MLNLKRSVNFDVFACVFILFLGFLFNYALNLILARWLPPERFGDFSVIKSVAKILAPLLFFGGADALTKFIPEYVAEKNWSLSKGYLIFFLIFGLCVLLLAASMVAFYVLLLDYESKHFLVSARPYIFCIWIIPLFAINVFLGKLLRSLNKPILSIVPSAVFTPIIFIIFIVFYSRLHWVIHLYDAILFFGLALVVTIAVQVLLFFLSAPKQIIQHPSSYHSSHWFVVAWKLMLFSLIFRLLIESDIIFLEIFGPSEQEVGYFAVTITIATLPWVIHQAIIVVFSPKISPLCKAHNYTALRHLFFESTLILCVLEIICFILLIIFAHTFLGWFGEIYQQAYYSLIIVLIAFLLSTVLSVPLSILQFGSDQSVLLTPTISIFILNIILNVALVPWIGIYGTVISLMVTRPFLSIWACVIAHKKYNLFGPTLKSGAK